MWVKTSKNTEARLHEGFPRDQSWDSLCRTSLDTILRTSLPPEVSVVCSADDTLVLDRGDGCQEVLELTESRVACVVKTSESEQTWLRSWEEWLESGRRGVHHHQHTWLLGLGEI